MQEATQIISSRWIAPVVPRNTVLEDHSLVVQAGKIVALEASETAIKKYPNAQVIERNNHLLIPGLINAHTHVGMSLFRGFADDMPLMTWLNDHIWPAESKWMSAEYVRAGTELAIAEMLLSGTTCFNDMYFFADSVAQVSQSMGIRAFVSMIVIDFPSAWASSADEYFEKGISVHDETRAFSRVNTTMSAHAPYTVSDESLNRVLTYADELHVPMVMHLHETEQEVSDALEQNGERPIARLHKLGLLNPRLMAVHMTQLTEQEIQLCTQQGISIVHCPESNMKLASGCCPVTQLLDHDANVCLGTDSTASNNDLDMLGEMRSASLLAKLNSNRADAVPAWQALEMATINGAKALNIDEQIGSLEVGKSADIVAVDLSDASTQPVYNPVSQLVYSANRNMVSDVWIAGKARVTNHQLQDINLNKILKNTSEWGKRIQGYE